MLTRTLRRALLDSRYSLPPTFLLPWTACLTTATAAVEANAQSLPPHTTPFSKSSNTTAASRPETLTARSSQTTISRSTPLSLSESVRELLPVLRAQGQIYITVHIHGKQYLLTEGDTLRLPFHMKEVELGDVLRLDRALYLGSRDLTLKPSAAAQSFMNPILMASKSESEISPSGKVSPAPHFVPHLAKGKHSYLDDRLFVCRAVVTGVESEPMRVMEKTKRRQRHIKHVKSKMRYTVLKIKELRVCRVGEIEENETD